VIELPSSLKSRVKWLVVPPDFHDRRGVNISFLEYVAKNIGVRRSSGLFVLAMNPDSIVSQQFVEAVARRPFNDRTLYLTSRFRILPRLLNSLPLPDIIQLIEEPWAQKAHRLEDFVDAERGSMKYISAAHDYGQFIFRSGTGDFILLARTLFDALGGFHEVAVNTHVDHFFVMKMMKLLPGYIQMYLPYTLMHQHHAKNKGQGIDALPVIYQYLRHGRTDLLGVNADDPDWGAPNETFEVLQPA
jgi:hypothetical protein